MPKYSYVGLCLLLAGFLFPVDRSAALDLSLRSQYYVPALIKPVQQIKYYRTDSDNIRILAGDGIYITLYDPASSVDPVVVSMRTGWVDYDILYADINRDSTADILVAYYFAYDTYGPDTTAALFAYDGASGFDLADSCFFECDLRTASMIPSPLRSVYLKATDLNYDGYNELLFSYDRHSVVDINWFSMLMTTLATTGQTIAYFSYPDSLAWTITSLMRDIEPFKKIDGANLLVGLRSSVYITRDWTGHTSHSMLDQTTDVFDGEGSAVARFYLPTPALCTGDSTDFINSFELLCQGNFDTTTNDTELLFRYHYYQSCTDYSSLTTSDTAFAELRMYRRTDGDTIELVWQRLEPDGFSDYVGLADYPGCFFAVYNKAVYRFNGLNGSLLETSLPIDADSLFWSEPDKAGKRQLLGVTDRTLAVYDFDQPTEAGDSDPGENLPSAFELETPYPNPFNGSTLLMYSLPRRSEVKVVVFNLLGQTVAVLAEGVQEAGQHRLTWDATGVSSGVYLIRAEFEDQKATVKAVLLK